MKTKEYIYLIQFFSTYEAVHIRVNKKGLVRIKFVSMIFVYS